MLLTVYCYNLVNTHESNVDSQVSVAWSSTSVAGLSPLDSPSNEYNRIELGD